VSHEIIFSGRLRDGFSIDTVRANFKEMFRVTDPATLNRLFSGGTVVLKRGVGPEHAKPLLTKLFQAGAVCEVRATAAAAPTEVRATAAAAAPATPPRTTPIPSALAARPNTAAAATIAPIAARSPRPGPASPASFATALSLVPEPDAHQDQPIPQQAAASPTRTPATQSNPLARNPPAIESWEAGSALPESAAGPCWGGFLSPLLWGSFNGMKLSFVPLLGIRFLRHVLPVWAWMLFYLAFGAFYLVQGRQLAWAHKSWNDVDHFNRIQRRWTIAGVPLFLLFMYGMIHLMQVDRLAARQTAALAALDVAVASHDHSAISHAREDYLQTISDPKEREAARQEYADEDRAEQQAADEEKAAEQEATGDSDSGAGE
jgi:hypothetical protein